MYNFSAAGIGSRLRPLTSSKPKCMVKVAGKSILQHQIAAFASVGIEEVVIIVGYEATRIEEYCKHIKNIKIKLISNSDYENTNNMYSLYLARNDVAGKRFVLVNGDVVFDPALIGDFVEHQSKDFVACDINMYSDESMKIMVNSDGYINAISKSIPEQKAYATSIDLYRFCENSSRAFFDEISRIIEQDKNPKEWTEVALDRLFQKQSLKMLPFDIGGKKWTEIDNYNDLAWADKVFSNFDSKFESKKLVFIDLDGTLYVGDKIIGGARRFLNFLNDNSIDYYFLSNNSSRSKFDYVGKLKSMCIEANAERIILSTDGTIEWLKREGVTNIYVVGTHSMKKMFINAGLEVEPENAEYVVLGYDTELTYEKLRKAVLFLQNGADLLATHCDMVCPTPEGPIPDIGSILAMFEAALKIVPYKVFGKPNPEMVAHIMQKHAVSPEETVVVGDRIYTDMELANRLGCDFICVLSGDTTREEIENLTVPPALVISNIGHILEGK